MTPLSTPVEVEGGGVSRPILFSAPMVRALLAGRKTQTRRIIPHRAAFITFHEKVTNEQARAHESAPVRIPEADRESACQFLVDNCPYGVHGDRLWVKETFKPIGPNRPAGYWTDPEWVGRECFYAADSNCPTWANWNWKPSIFMSRALSRIDLEVTAVRVERVQDITNDDADEEGLDGLHRTDCRKTSAAYDESGVCVEPASCSCGDHSMAECYGNLWDSINGKRAPWAGNPWVWVVAFRVVRP